MSLFGSKTFDWEPATKRGNLMWKHPRNIRLNDNVVVREDEIAVFYRDGKALAYFDRPDRYALTSINAPVVGPLVKFLSGVEQKAEVYYLQKKPFDGKFGSKQPYQFRDPEFHVVSLRVFGQFRYRISSPENFLNKFVGTLGVSTKRDVEERLKEQVLVVTYDALGEMKKRGLAVLDLAANLEEIEQVILANSKDHFAPYGIEVNKIVGLHISMPEAVQKAVDARSSMAITGTSYMQYQSGAAMRDAASQPGGGGAAGAGVGIGAGIGMGTQMMGAMNQPAQAPAPMGGKPCVKCGTNLASGAKFCPNCGASQTPAQKSALTCPKCNATVKAGARFCSECGNSMAPPECSKCGRRLSLGAKFCPECGTKTG